MSHDVTFKVIKYVLALLYAIFALLLAINFIISVFPFLFLHGSVDFISILIFAILETIFLFGFFGAIRESKSVLIAAAIIVSLSLSLLLLAIYGHEEELSTEVVVCLLGLCSLVLLTVFYVVKLERSRGSVLAADFDNSCQLQQPLGPFGSQQLAAALPHASLPFNDISVNAMSTPSTRVRPINCYPPVNVYVKF